MWLCTPPFPSGIAFSPNVQRAPSSRKNVPPPVTLHASHTTGGPSCSSAAAVTVLVLEVPHPAAASIAAAPHAIAFLMDPSPAARTPTGRTAGRHRVARWLLRRACARGRMGVDPPAGVTRQPGGSP